MSENLRLTRLARRDRKQALKCCASGKECSTCGNVVGRFAHAIVHRHVSRDDGETKYTIVCTCSDCYVRHMNARLNIDGTSEYGVREHTCIHCGQPLENTPSIVAVLPLDCDSEEQNRLQILLAEQIVESDDNLRRDNVHVLE